MNTFLTLFLLYTSPIVLNGISFLILSRYKIEELNTTSYKFLYFVSIGFSFLGLTMGLFTGLSMTPVVGTIVPAFLTFIGALITYIFFKENESLINRIIAIECLIFLSVFLFIGGYNGIQQRKIVEIEQKKLDFHKEVLLKKIDLEAKKELIQFEKTLKDSIDIEEIPFENIPIEK